MLRNLARTALLAGATSLALIVGTPAEATSKHLTILASVPDLAFPFFVYMMGQIKDEANRLGDITIVESDGRALFAETERRPGSCDHQGR